jgi:hypothetical protein
MTIISPGALCAIDGTIVPMNTNSPIVSFMAKLILDLLDKWLMLQGHKGYIFLGSLANPFC